MNDPNDAFLLGRMDSKLDSLVNSLGDMKKTSDNHEVRLNDLEDDSLQSKTQRRTLALTIGGAWGVIVALLGLFIAYRQ